jgi:hypothetical protein
MRREQALNVVLVAVGILFMAGIYPPAMRLLHPQKWEYSDVLMQSLYVTLGIFLPVAARSPWANRALTAFAAWSILAHAIVMVAQALPNASMRGDLTAALVVIGVTLLALAPAGSPQSPHGLALMTGAEIMDRIREASPGPSARMTGALYLLYFLTAILAQFLVDRGFALSGNVSNVIATMCYLIVTFLFYGRFKPVSGSLSLLAALFSLAGCVVMTLGLFHVASSPTSSLLFLVIILC